MSTPHTHTEGPVPPHSSEPLAIAQPISREPSVSFFNWPTTSTDSLSSFSPASSSSLLPDAFSPSSSFSSDCPLSPLSSDLALPSSHPPSQHQHQSEAWRTAAREAADGVHYTLEPFPSPGSTVLPPPFRDEPLQVAGGARVALLDEVGQHAVRVRLLDGGGAVGLLPAWNLEGALERLARLNMEFNEAATCPAERRGPEGQRASGSKPALAHSHDRCVPFASRLIFRSPDDESDDDADDAGYEDDLFGFDRGARKQTLRPSRAVYEVRPGRERRKAVEFARVERAKVFRYPSEALIEAYYGGAEEEPETGVSGDDEEDGQWWWAGWEEPAADASLQDG